jgi:MFS family permease
LVTRRTISGLLGAVLLAPIAIVLLVGTGFLLGALGDAAGRRTLLVGALAAALFWVFSGICLLAALAAEALERREPPDIDELPPS